MLDNIEARVQRAYRGREPSALIPRMTPSAELDELVSPKTRRAHLANLLGGDTRLPLGPAGLADSPCLGTKQFLRAHSDQACICVCVGCVWQHTGGVLTAFPAPCALFSR